jgi:hypothetical protein
MGLVLSLGLGVGMNTAQSWNWELSALKRHRVQPQARINLSRDLLPSIIIGLLIQLIRRCFFFLYLQLGVGVGIGMVGVWGGEQGLWL